MLMDLLTILAILCMAFAPLVALAQLAFFSGLIFLGFFMLYVVARLLVNWGYRSEGYVD